MLRVLPRFTTRRAGRIALALLLVALTGWGVAKWWTPSMRPLATQPVAAKVTGPPDFTGRWQLDLKESGSMAPILKAKGRNAIEQGIAATLPITHIIKQSEQELTVRIETPLFTREEKIRLDGVPIASEDLERTKVESKSRWSDDGRAIITEAYPLDKEDPSHVTMRRYLADDGLSMFVDLDYQLPGDQRFQLRRVFRRVEE
jgi:hypothetical protein